MHNNSKSPVTAATVHEANTKTYTNKSQPLLNKAKTPKKQPTQSTHALGKTGRKRRYERNVLNDKRRKEIADMCRELLKTVRPAPCPNYNPLPELDVIFSHNSRNRKKASSNTGRLGVSYCKKSKRYLADVSINSKSCHIGKFIRLSDAVEARKIATDILYVPLSQETRGAE